MVNKTYNQQVTHTYLL